MLDRTTLLIGAAGNVVAAFICAWWHAETQGPLAAAIVLFWVGLATKKAQR